jgi:hypothetical protein
LPQGASIHDVFHIELLKKYKGEPPPASATLPPIRHGRVCLEPAQAIKCRLARGRQEILVRWNNQDAAEASWIDLEEFRKKEHSLHSQFRGTSRVNCQVTSGSKLKGLFEMVKLIITIITGRGVFSMHYIRTYSN